MHAGRTPVWKRAIPPVGRGEQTGTCSLQRGVCCVRPAVRGGGCRSLEERVVCRGRDRWVPGGGRLQTTSCRGARGLVSWLLDWMFGSRLDVLVHRRFSAPGWAV
ncbi:hypothetical protein NDU88_009948 [Pleurodeles waltl]|uniref:Uncharacterized protein n=1 Tax=Pleurodeles waltl TaxID=8319 RepID=A0AAV7S2H4_PLEWA|nr:hypothetical protein NDU88_009948 [Pleurodeles waltl]